MVFVGEARKVGGLQLLLLGSVRARGDLQMAFVRDPLPSGNTKTDRWWPTSRARPWRRSRARMAARWPLSGAALEPGAVFGADFRIVRELRAGGMGAVYVVDQLSTGKQRALKVMATALAGDPATRERFVFEARAASAVDSDHVVEIVTAGVDTATGAPFLVMELLRGEK